MNLFAWFLTGLKFLLCIHYFACGWIIIYLVKDVQGVDTVAFAETGITERYFESVYMITTTITTVGYGDYKAFNDTTGIWQAEMCYLYLISLGGPFLFTTVSTQVFQYQKLKKVNEIVNEQCKDMEEYLYNISSQRHGKFLGTKKIEECLMVMENTIRSSTQFHFENNHFY